MFRIVVLRSICGPFRAAAIASALFTGGDMDFAFLAAAVAALEPIAGRLAFLHAPFALEHVAAAGTAFAANVLALDYVDEQKYAYAAGAINYGFPTIANTKLFPKSDFSPNLRRVRLNGDGTMSVLQKISLARTDGTPITGLRIGASLSHYSDLRGQGPVTWNDAFRAGLAAQIDASPALANVVVAPEGSMDAALTSLNVWTISAEYLWEKWRFAAEYQRNHSQVTIDTVVAVSGTLPFFGNAPFSQTQVNKQVVYYEPEAFYVQAGYELYSWLKLSGTASYFYGDNDEHHPDNTESFQHDYYVSARFDITDSWILKTDLHYIHGNAMVGSQLDAEPDLATDDVMFVVKTTFGF